MPVARLMGLAVTGLLAAELARGTRIDVWNRRNRQGSTPLPIAQGHGFGNFKPSVETIAAIEAVMRAAGIAHR